MVSVWAADITPLLIEETYQAYYDKVPEWRKDKADKLKNVDDKARSVGAWILWEKMKKVLIKAAKEAGQSCAYIVRGISGATLEVYRVDLKDGKEARVRATSFRLPDLTKLLTLVAISSKEEVLNYLPNNYPASMIYPAGIIVDGLVIEKATVKAEKEPVLTLPQQRK